MKCQSCGTVFEEKNTQYCPKCGRKLITHLSNEGYQFYVFYTDTDNKKSKLKVNIKEADHNIDGIDFHSNYFSRSNYEGYISIEGIDFNGNYFSRSKNDNFILASRPEYTTGYRTRNEFTTILVHALVAFIKKDELFLISDLWHPNNGKVAENGNFIIYDSEYFDYYGTFYAFNSEAKVLIKREFNSNLGNNGISENGRYAIQETNYGKSEDENKIFFFDLYNKKLLWDKRA